MLVNLPGYEITEFLHESQQKAVYRGFKLPNREPVIIKALKKEHPTQEEYAMFTREYELTKDINCSGMVKIYSSEKISGMHVLIMEDFGGISLKEYLSIIKLDLASFFKIAGQLNTILGVVHLNSIIHRDIKPPNIIINPNTMEVKITDFSISTVASMDYELTTIKEDMVGSLAYISPEQTGRVNSIVDFRSDYYSLGVTFYEMLTGLVPFDTKDPMELVHAHIAMVPVPPHQIAQVPVGLSMLIMKLLEKNPQERYQSSFGIRFDLDRCFEAYTTTGNIDKFSLGQGDITNNFKLQTKIYGRVRENSKLLAVYERVSLGSKELFLLLGSGGIGKTALVTKGLKPIALKSGFFITGKFEEMKRDIPYSAIVKSLKELIGMILATDKDEFALWQRKIIDALGPNGAMIIDLVPEVELITGPQPSVEELPPTESRNRLKILFQRFLSVFAKAEHPLVISLDDLQWADTASLELIEFLCKNSEITHLMIVGTSRINELSVTHPLTISLTNLRNAGININEVHLGPLTLSQTNQLIADTLQVSEEKAASLGEILYRKTSGNPFFLGQLFKVIYQENLIKFSPVRRTWEWEIGEIEDLPKTNNVIELLVAKFEKLPKDTRRAIEYGAFFGNNFNLSNLGLVLGLSDVETAKNLWPAVADGLIVQKDSNDYGNIQYEFFHDRVREAAYASISGQEKKELHLKIGRLLLMEISNDRIEEEIFTIIDHFNLGLELIYDETELVKLAQYNLLAGKKAKGSCAFEAASNYFNTGIHLLAQDSWGKQYELTYELYLAASQCEYICGNFQGAEELFEVIFKKAKTSIEKAGVYGVKMVLQANLSHHQEAINLGVDGLRQLGMILSAKPSKLDILKELALVRWRLKGRSNQELINLPELTDPRQQKIMELLMHLVPSANITNDELFAMVILKMLNLSLQYGQCQFTPFAFGSYGFLEGVALGDYEKCRRFTGLTKELMEKYPHPSIRCKVYFAIGGYLEHWNADFNSCLDFLNQSYQYGLESGELLFAGYALSFILGDKFYMGVPLPDLAKECEEHLKFIRGMVNDNSLFMLLTKQLVLNLQGKTDDPLTLDNEEFSEEKVKKFIIENNLKPVYINYFMFKGIILYLNGQFTEAIQLADEALQLFDGSKDLAEYNFYLSLIITACYPSLSPGKQKKYLKQLAKNQVEMAKWAKTCPVNFAHKLYLIQAEWARIKGQDLEAMQLYEKAIKTARENGFTQNEAVANELVGRFYLAKGMETVAKAYLNEAYHGFNKWGAIVKVRSLEKEYPDLINPFKIVLDSGVQTRQKSLETMTMTDSGSSGSGSWVIDLAAIFKVSQAISGEMVFSNLLKKLMDIVIENAGAQKGYLIMDRDSRLIIEAIGTAGTEPRVLESIPLEESSDLAGNIVRYVARTKEYVVLDDAVQQGIFTRDDYVLTKSPKSILCIPVIDQGSLVGILYLENNLATGVFTAERVEVLKLISSQFAISIENSMLYTSLTESRDQLATALDELEIKNQKIENLNIAMVSALENANLFNDNDTGNHIRRVSAYSALIARAYGCHEDFVKRISVYSSLHDVGKVGIAHEILRKPGKFTPEEFDIMKQHVIMGRKMLESSEIDHMAQNIALYHHEKWDGTGYMFNLKGEEIPLEARIVAVADVYDALTTERPYKKAFSEEEADKIMEEGRGTHFDPKIIDIFFASINEIREIKNKLL